MASYVDAGDMASQYTRQESPLDYPTPSASSDAGTAVKEEPAKRKRKAWGQAVPEIVKILPPRKRAKTAEEKEQRKNERILRNRRAADKSRQRQKAAQAGLEQQNKDLLAENAQLRALIEQHGLEFSFVPPPPSVTFSDDREADTPDISYPTPSSSEAAPQQSPCIAPQLDASQISMPSISSSSTDLTQYPAVSVGFGEETSVIGSDFYGQYDLNTHPLLDNCDDLFTFNSLADPQALPDFGREIGNDFFSSVGNDCPAQLSAATYFDFNAFDTDTTGGFPSETSQPNSSLQPQFSASFDDGRRQGFAAETR